MLRAVTRRLMWIVAAMASGAVLLLSAAFLYLNPQVPDTETFSNVTIRAPLRIYSSDGKLIQEFGERLVFAAFGNRRVVDGGDHRRHNERQLPKRLPFGFVEFPRFGHVPALHIKRAL